MAGNYYLRNKIFVSFAAVILIISSFATFVGIRLIGKSVIPRIQDKVRLDLNLGRDMYQKTVKDVRNVIRLTSIRFFIKDALKAGDMDLMTLRLEEVRQNESLDILTLVDPGGNVLLRTRNPKQRGDSQVPHEIIRKAVAEKSVVASTEILTEEVLRHEGEDLATRARIRIIPTSHAIPPQQAEQTSAMFIISAAPILSQQHELLGILYGGRMLDNNHDLADRIRDTIYERTKYNGKDIGAVTLFQGDVRISTSIVTKQGDRAVGTLVDAEVERTVLQEGNNRIGRAFAVDDWYITAYQPVENISGKRVGILGIGVLESKYRNIERKALWFFLGITFVGIVLSVLLCYFLTHSIMRPINLLLSATRSLAGGNLKQQVRLERAPREIDALGNAFNSMAASIQERDEQLRQRAQEEIMKSERLAMVGQLAAGVAHELNNPLGGILLFSGLLIQKAPPAGLMRENLERVQKEAKRCQNIVQGLLDFAREREPKIEAIDINDIAEKAINLFENQPIFHNIEVVKAYQRGLPLIFADQAQIQQVLVNIIINAADALRGKGTLTITTRSAAEDVEISFSDTGKGIPPEHLDRVFEPFFTTKGVGHGTGLGLSISYGIVQRHGGDIKLFSRVNEGSTFVVSLPKSEEHS